MRIKQPNPVNNNEIIHCCIHCVWDFYFIFYLKSAAIAANNIFPVNHEPFVLSSWAAENQNAACRQTIDYARGTANVFWSGKCHLFSVLLFCFREKWVMLHFKQIVLGPKRFCGTFMSEIDELSSFGPSLWKFSKDLSSKSFWISLA